MLNKTITVAQSSVLSAMKLSKLVGRQGRVIEDLTQVDRMNKGYLVQFEKAYLKFNIWFIPIESAVYE